MDGIGLSNRDGRGPQAAAEAAATGSQTLRILVVEDSADDAELVQRALRRDGLTAVYSRVDDLAALEAALDAGPWDVVLSDYRLPGFTGLEVVERVQARGQDCPLILVSGTIGEESVVDVLKAGAHDYVLKDDLTRLGRAIRRELREAANRQERRAAAEALRFSEMRLRLITDSMLDLISEVDLTGRMRYASPSHRTTLGYDPADLIGQVVFDFIHPDDLAGVLTNFQMAAERSQPASVICRFRHAAGHYIWVESSGNPVLDSAGQAASAVLSSRDITARRQAELAEREQRQLAEALSNTAAALSGSLDLPVVLERVLDNVGRVVPHDAAMIMLADDQALRVAAQRGLTRFTPVAGLVGQQLPAAEAASAAAILSTGRAAIIEGHPQCANPALAAALGWARTCLGAPLRHRDEIIGLISLHSAAPAAFAETQAARLQALADQAAVAIANARLFESERQRVTELQRLNGFTTALARVSARIESTVDPDQAMQFVGETLRQLGLWCFIALPEAGSARLQVHYTNLESVTAQLAMRTLGLQPGPTPLSDELFPDVYTAVRTGRPVLRTNVLTDLPAGWQTLPRPLAEFALGQMQLRPGVPFAVIPLLVDEQVRGVLSVWGGDLREADAAPLSVFAGQLAAALEKVRLLETERRRTAELDRSNRLISALADVSARVQAAPAMEAVLETLGARLQPLGVTCLVALLEPGAVDLRLHYLSLESKLLALTSALTGLTMDTYRVPRRATLISECLDQRRPVFTRDLVPLIAAMLPSLANVPVGKLASLLGLEPGLAALFLPLQVEDETLGLIALWGRALEPVDLPAYTVFASQVAAALHTAQLVARLDQARRAAEEANRLKSLFLANVSHELRTPLTGILGSLDLVLGGVCETPAEEHQFLGLARDAGQRLHRLINDLLDLARIEAGHLQVTLQALNVTPVVVEACVLCRPAAEAKQIRLNVDVSLAEPVHAWADPDRLTQIMLNLVGNAVKFTEAGEVRVSIVANPCAGEVEIRVQDTGIGIPASLQAQLFRPFVQVDLSSTRKYGGTGLGLAISRRLAELMQGRLTLHSAGAGAGATFSVYLPLVEPAVAWEAPGHQSTGKEGRA